MKTTNENAHIRTSVCTSVSIDMIRMSPKNVVWKVILEDPMPSDSIRIS
jgi:hypothetical protein